MAATTSITPKTEISSSVSTSMVAEIHREDTGNIFYVCFHCGLNLDNIADTLTHIALHFDSQQDIKIDEDPLDFIVIKNEFLDDEEEALEGSQHKQLFINKLVDNMMSMNEDLFVQIDTGQQATTSARECIPSSREKLINHQRSAGVEEVTKQRISCTLCPQTLTGEVNFMQHTFTHFNLKVFTCTECAMDFRRKATLNDHMHKKHSKSLIEYKFQCRFCNHDAGDLLEYVTHAFTYHLDEGDVNNSDLNSMFNYDCQFCSTNFTQWDDVYKHLKMHKEDKLPKIYPFHTTPNGRCFSERAQSGMYRSEILYNCTKCMKTLCGSLEARNHLIADHKESKKYICKDNGMCHEDLALKPIIPTEVFKCYDCDEVLKSRLNFMKHRLEHFNIRLYPCTLCSKAFNSTSSAIRHMKVTHNINPYQNQYFNCRYCKAKFIKEIDFVTHMFNDHLYANFNKDEQLDGKCKYECVNCNEITTEQKLMVKHLNIHESEVASKIETNTDATSFEASMNELHHKVDYMYCCLHCPKKFRLVYVMSQHHRMNHKIEENDIRKKSKESTTCDICNTTFLTWRSMVNHRGQKHPETNNPNGWPKYKLKKRKNEPESSRDTNCNVCNKSFPTWRSMLNHKANRHPETHKVDRTKNRPKCHCKTCGRAFRERNTLTKHERTHTQDRPYTCDICNKTYSLKVTLKTHMFTHTKQKNFVCEQCGKSYVSVSKLNLHSQIHENLTLECTTCHKIFHTRKNFTSHQRTHGNYTRKECKLCHKTYKSALSLRIHMLLHTGEKKYACRFCDMTFAQSSGRRGHERTKHEKVN